MSRLNAAANLPAPRRTGYLSSATSRQEARAGLIEMRLEHARFARDFRQGSHDERRWLAIDFTKRHLEAVDQ
jgi:hypothetical protein